MVLETFELLGPFHLNLNEGLLYFFFTNCVNGNNAFLYVVTFVDTLLERQVQLQFDQLGRGDR